MAIGSIVSLNDELRPEGQRPARESEQVIMRNIRLARARVRKMLQTYDNGPATPYEAEVEFEDAIMMETKLQTALAVAVASRECDECQDGHQDHCLALEPCEDLYDVLWRDRCEGCCPNGCREAGLQLLATVTGRKFSKMLGVIR